MRRIIAVLSLSVVLFGCKAKEKADIAADLHKHGTVDLMKQIADDRYTVPADGKLTDAQVQMYLKVREHEKDIAQVAKKEAQEHADAAKKAGEKSIAGMMEGFKTLSSAAQIATADLRAAKDLGYNTQEYVWVKGQILAASAAAASETIGSVMAQQMDATAAQWKKAYDEAKDETSKKTYKEMLDNLEKSKQESAAQKKQEDPALTYNRQLLAKYENSLNALTSEMSKWEDHPGDAAKSMDQLKKDLDKAAQDAKKN